MNSTNILEFVQTGFRASLGATTSLVEILQDSQKREENLSQLRSDFSQKVAEWAEKGEKTEQEARNLIEQMFNRQNNPDTSGARETPRDTPTTASTPSAVGNTQEEIEQLTAQIAAIRTELEQMRNSQSNN
jgi:polyhydroxyalkanoate synthesis regulator phasin